MDKTVRVGFLGVGLMGHGAAKNILEKVKEQVKEREAALKK